MPKYEIQDEFGYKLGIVTADNRENAKVIGKKRYKRNKVRAIKRDFILRK